MNDDTSCQTMIEEIKYLCRRVMDVNIHLPYTLREEEYTMSSHALAMRILEVIRNNTSSTTKKGDKYE